MGGAEGADDGPLDQKAIKVNADAGEAVFSFWCRRLPKKEVARRFSRASSAGWCGKGIDPGRDGGAEQPNA